MHIAFNVDTVTH